MAAALGHHLVLDVHRGHPGALVGLHRAAHIEHTTIAVVAVGDQRQAAGIRNAPGVVGHLGQGQQADVRHAQAHRGGAGAGHVDRLKAVLGDNPRVHRIGHTGRHDGAGLRHQLP